MTYGNLSVSLCCRRARRRGAVLVAVMVCLLVVTLMSAALVRSILAQNRQAAAERQKLQAFWLAESAIDRAVAQLRASPEYTGEEWRVTASQEGHSQTGVAVIRVPAATGDSPTRVVAVAAYWPDDPTHRVLEEREFTFEIK